MKSFKLSVLFLLLTTVQSYAQKWEVGQTYSDPEKLISLIIGDIPLVISVPHGGTNVLPDIATRDCKNAVTVTDSRTIELALAIQNAFLAKYKMRPFIVYTALSRKQVDQNREINEGTCGNKVVEKYWHQFHDYIDTAVSLAGKKFGKVVYIDLHGHGHPKQRLELGYGPNAAAYRDFDKQDSKAFAQTTSVNNLLNADKTITLKDLIYGNNSFGTLIQDAGFGAVPSKQDPYPLADEAYFNGGYNTRRYTSSKYPNVFGWQIESNFKGVRDEAGRPLFAEAFVSAMATYFKTYLNFKL